MTMRPEEYEKLADILGEGFEADKLVLTMQRMETRRYVDDIRNGRLMIKGFRPFHRGNLTCLARSLRFLDWLKQEYGKKTFKNREDAEDFVEKILEDIRNLGENWKKFFGYVRQITLSEASQILVR